MSKLVFSIADVLCREAVAIGARWASQAHFVAPRPLTGARASGEDAERLVAALATTVGGGGAHDAAIAAGWAFGATAHAQRVSLHDLLKELDLLAAMVLYAAEQALADVPGETAADGMQVARRIQRAFSLLTRAAANGFTHAYQERRQQTWRDLRHELRNPLGTIKSAVTLMDDESLPPELRNNPRFRAMVLRNAETLDQVIAERLGDAAALAPAFGPREVSLRQVALAVRRDLREQASRKACEVVVADSLPTALVDAAGFELALTSAVTAALAAASSHSAVAVTLRERRERSAVVAVVCEPEVDGGGRPPETTATFARALLERSGGRVWADAEGLCLEVPTLGPRSAAHPADDVARAR